MKRNNRDLILGALLACIAIAPACSEGLEPTGRITKPRIIGVRSVVRQEPVGEGPARTNARPGETLDLTFLVTQPGEETANAWAFLICVPAATTFGVARCEGEPLDFVSSMAPSLGAPAFSFQVPEGTNADLLYVGAVCLGGALREFGGVEDMESLESPCAGEGTGRLLTGALRVQTEESPENYAPSIEGVTLDGESWMQPPPGGEESCADLPSLSYSAGSAMEIEVFPSAGSREPYNDGEVEELPVAFFSTERGLSRFYHVIEDRTPHARADFDVAEIPRSDAKTIPDEGRVVRFEFVMRDDRGGVDRATRSLCLLP